MKLSASGKGKKFTILLLAIISLSSCNGGKGNHIIDTDTTTVVNCVSDIVPIEGYERICQDDPFAKYLRSMPFKKGESTVSRYDGSPADMPCYKVIDMPLLCNDEQCADILIHLRAEYLYKAGRYSDIHFNNYSKIAMQYHDGENRTAFEKYLKTVFQYANTYTMTREMKKVPFRSIQPGDVFMFAKEDRKNAILGHAIVVLDVALNETEEKMIIAAQGYTPACDFHVIKNWNNGELSPWIRIPADISEIELSGYTFYTDDLYRF